MTAKVQLTTKFPVVFYNEDVSEPGWYYRGAEDVALYGPFGHKDEAIAFGLDAISKGIPEHVKPARTRRAA